MMNKAMNNNMDINMMIKENMGLAYMVINKYYANYKECYMEEMEQIAMISLFKAIQSYDKNKGAFSTLATKLIKNDLCSFVVNGLKKYNGVADGTCTSMYANNGDEEDSNSTLLNLLECEEDYTNVQVNDLLELILTTDERMQTIVKMLVEGYNYSEIGETIGCSKQRVGQLVVKLRKEIQKAYPIDSYILAKQIVKK